MSAVENAFEDSTVGKSIWEEAVSKRTDMGGYIDIAGANYLSPVIDAYMTSPVGFYNSKPIAAQTLAFNDINELRNQLMADGTRIVMYMLIYIPSQPVYSEVDINTGETIYFDKPKMSPGGYKLRYAPAEAK